MKNENDPAQSNQPKTRRSGLWFMAAVIGAALAAVGGTALLVNIMERKQEAKNPFYRVVEITDETVDPAIWGKDFPFHVSV
ncbi:hypothetical protein SDC9_192668 [bioreactor metagenome]|uniref:Uncharacterized protein n=1 Tax=bioreactor metagenome TaxID=1076179 RepID=A0A645I1D4_9ZZZZ